MYFIWVYYALRARTPFFFAAANPSITNGGFLMESKKAIYDIIPPRYIPKTLCFAPDEKPETILSAVAAAGIVFPCIAKPDIGMKGLGVEKIPDSAQLARYAQRIGVPFLVQTFIDFPEEVGVFYCRLPEEEKGRITGIVYKELLIVTGDGQVSVRELIRREPRFLLQLPALEKRYGEKLDEILSAGETLNLVPYGNHARGAKFIDASHWANERLTATIDTICRQIPGFYFGRLDIKYLSLEALERGEHFLLVEVNGAGSEPTHMYDPDHSIFFAWKEIRRHLGLCYKTSVQNHRKGVPYLTWREGLKMFADNAAMVKKLKSFE